MRRAIVALPLALAACGSEPAPGDDAAALVTTEIALPAEHAALPATPAGDLIASQCTACHSADLITRQPPLDAKKWGATVTKMREAYKANIAPADDAALVRALLTLQGHDTA